MIFTASDGVAVEIPVQYIAFQDAYAATDGAREWIQFGVRGLVGPMLEQDAIDARSGYAERVAAREKAARVAAGDAQGRALGYIKAFDLNIGENYYAKIAEANAQKVALGVPAEWVLQNQGEGGFWWVPPNVIQTPTSGSALDNALQSITIGVVAVANLIGAGYAVAGVAAAAGAGETVAAGAAADTTVAGAAADSTVLGTTTATGATTATLTTTADTVVLGTAADAATVSAEAATVAGAEAATESTVLGKAAELAAEKVGGIGLAALAAKLFGKSAPSSATKQTATRPQVATAGGAGSPAAAGSDWVKVAAFVGAVLLIAGSN